MTGKKRGFEPLSLTIWSVLRILIARIILSLVSHVLLATVLWIWLDREELDNYLLKNNDNIELFELLTSCYLPLCFLYSAWPDKPATPVFTTPVTHCSSWWNLNKPIFKVLFCKTAIIIQTNFPLWHFSALKNKSTERLYSL